MGGVSSPCFLLRAGLLGVRGGECWPLPNKFNVWLLHFNYNFYTWFTEYFLDTEKNVIPCTTGGEDCSLPFIFERCDGTGVSCDPKTTGSVSWAPRTTGSLSSDWSSKGLGSCLPSYVSAWCVETSSISSSSIVSAGI